MERGIVTAAVAPLMYEPNENCIMADEALHGMDFTIIGAAAGGWLHVSMSYGYEGFLRERDVSIGGGEGRRVFVVGSFADVLAAPDIKARVNMTLPRGAIVVVENASCETVGRDGYTEVLTACGDKGFVRSALLGGNVVVSTAGKLLAGEIAAGNSSVQYKIREVAFRDSVVNTAYKYLGTPYRYGGKTPLGIDCSGLCSMAYLLNGVCIYRDSVMKDGFPVKKIPRERLKKADLIYFPGHIAMYVGGGRFIHSSVANDGVYVNSLDKGDAGYKRELVESITEFGSVFYLN